MLFIILIIVTSCDLEPPSNSNKIDSVKTIEYPSYYIAEPGSNANGSSIIFVTIYKKDDIEYRIFTNNSYYGKSIFVVNHTKELLEIELLKKQLNKK